ncbi:DUF6584 family protein [Catellatospora tritici]|uniref:DUF6584 family protein n=1 Tax=Catellatospora tritici TaxID=2851566 RepID=UPI001C2D0EE2|nr:DUF6584 family protein [Catellatospora tritici]MBV1852205.1 hypothetical protein [Catellatospora tritici]
MGKSDLMDRVATDLTKGHTYPAIQRMHSLVAAHPTDLDLRRRLAAIYRATGNAVEAGRWSYLDDSADPAEIGAFESRYPLHRRLEALRWPAGAHAPTDISRVRLAPLQAVAVATPTSAAPPGLRRLTTATAVTALVALALLAVIGAQTVLEWLF